MWKVLSESVEGTSHRQINAGCQDSVFTTPYKAGAEDVLILACADGAGSATKSDVGSKLACETVAQQAMTFFDSGGALEEVNEEVLRAWFMAVHDTLRTEAERLETQPRELACTLLVSILGPTSAAFAQLGDGALVILDDGTYRTVFWPQHGEYQNTTFFITEPDHIGQALVQCVPKRVDELAMFTDGLQMLALNYASQTVHQPFFAPMFQALRAAEDHQDLILPLRAFLDSQAVNDRTDDDKTLILATRVSSGDAAV